MPEMGVQIYVPAKLWPLTPDLAASIDRQLAEALRAVGVEEIEFWAWDRVLPYMDDEGNWINVNGYERAATGEASGGD